VGSIHIAVTIAGSGRVTSVKIVDRAVDESVLGICLKRAMKALAFPPFRGNPIGVDIPIVITTPG
jgi:hypothetical protein